MAFWMGKARYSQKNILLWARSRKESLKEKAVLSMLLETYTRVNLYLIKSKDMENTLSIAEMFTKDNGRMIREREKES